MHCPDDHPGRLRPADQYALPWEHTPDTGNEADEPRRDVDLDAEFADALQRARIEARRMKIQADQDDDAA